MKLPKLYRPVKIKFWSLRNGIGQNLGVIFDIDTQVERIARRVITDKYPNGWHWQLLIKKYEYFYDGNIETDIECLNEAFHWQNYKYIEIDYTNLKLSNEIL